MTRSEQAGWARLLGTALPFTPVLCRLLTLIISECDTPPALSDFAFDWLEQSWKHDVDFVIVTGDNARCVNPKSTTALPYNYSLFICVSSRFLASPQT